MTFHASRRNAGVLASAVAATLMLGACGGSAAPAEGGPSGEAGLPDLDSAYSAELDKLYEAALAAGETEVVLYSNKRRCRA